MVTTDMQIYGLAEFATHTKKRSEESMEWTGNKIDLLKVTLLKKN
jgi:hypothetical protein